MKKKICNKHLTLGNFSTVTVSTPHSEGSTLSSKLDPWLITGFVDGDGSFTVSIYKNKLQKQGFTVKATLQIGLDEKDRLLLESIRSYFGGVGNITKLGKDTIQYRVSSTKDLKEGELSPIL